MFVKRAFHLLLFLTIIYAENVNGINVQLPPPNFNLTEDTTNVTAPTISPSTTHKPSIVTTSLTTKSSVIHIATETTAIPKSTEPFYINHNRTATSISSTNKPLPTSTTQPSTTAKIVLPGSSTTSIDVPKSRSDVIHTSTDKSTTKDESVSTQHTTPSPTTTTNSSNTMPMEGTNGQSKTTAAGIVALICVSVASIAFVALFAWRYVYRKKHGNREILINEEDVDFNDEDLRHFEATCIQLEPDA